MSELKKYWVPIGILEEDIAGDTTNYCEVIHAEEVEALLTEMEQLQKKLKNVEWLKNTWSEFDEPLDAECRLSEPAETILMFATDWYSNLKTATDALKKLKRGENFICIFTGHAGWCDCGRTLIEKALAKIKGINHE